MISILLFNCSSLRLVMHMGHFSTPLDKRQMVRHYTLAFISISLLDVPVALYRNIPLDTEILVTHTPAFQVLDLTRKGKHAGCRSLAETVKGLKQCRLHVFGHIHEAHGSQVISRPQPDGELVSVNAAIPRRRKAIVVDLQH